MTFYVYIGIFHFMVPSLIIPSLIVPLLPFGPSGIILAVRREKECALLVENDTYDSYPLLGRSIGTVLNSIPKMGSLRMSCFLQVAAFIWQMDSSNI